MAFIRALMPHLKRSTLRRHALITPFEPGACWNEQRFQSPGGFLSKPVPMWVSRTIFEMTFDNFAAKEDLHGRPQRRVEMPYISSVRWDPKWEASGHVPPWKAPADAPPRRSLLACFTGTLRGRPESIRMRTILVEQCNGAASKTVCHTLLDGNSLDRAAERDGGRRPSDGRAAQGAQAQAALYLFVWSRRDSLLRASRSSTRSSLAASPSCSTQRRIMRSTCGFTVDGARTRA